MSALEILVPVYNHQYISLFTSLSFMPVTHNIQIVMSKIALMKYKDVESVIIKWSITRHSETGVS